MTFDEALLVSNEPGHESGRAGRCPGSVGKDRCPQEPRDRAAVLRGPDRRGNGSGAQSVAGHRDARLAPREGVAAQGAEEVTLNRAWNPMAPARNPASAEKWRHRMVGGGDAVDLFDQHAARRVSSGSRALDEHARNRPGTLGSQRFRIRQPGEQRAVPPCEIGGEPSFDQEDGSAHAPSGSSCTDTASLSVCDCSEAASAESEVRGRSACAVAIAEVVCRGSA